MFSCPDPLKRVEGWGHENLKKSEVLLSWERRQYSDLGRVGEIGHVFLSETMINLIN